MKKTILSIGSVLAVVALIFVSFNQAQAKAIKKSHNGNSLKNGLVGWWTFDNKDMLTTTANTMKDKSGNGNDGLISTSTIIVDGKIRQAGLFDGVTSYVELGPSPILNLTSTISISAWVKYTATNTTDRFIYRRSGNYGVRMYAAKNSTQVVFSFHPADASLWAATSTAGVNDDKWHLFVGTYDGVQLKMYTDGVVSLGDVTSTQIFYQTQDSTIGRGANETARPFHGSIDEVRIYNRALSSAEVMRLYKRGGENKDK